MMHRTLRFMGVALGLASLATLSAQEKGTPRPEIEAPFVSTPHDVVAAMLKLADVREGDVVLDLGCGDGRIPIAAVRDFRARGGVGLEFHPERLHECHAAAKKAGPTIQKKLLFRQGDVLKLTPADLKAVDVVTISLLPEMNERLKPVLRAGLKPGARVVSHDFDMGTDWPAEKTQELHVNDVGHTIFLWTIPKP